MKKDWHNVGIKKSALKTTIFTSLTFHNFGNFYSIILLYYYSGQNPPSMQIFFLLFLINHQEKIINVVAYNAVFLDNLQMCRVGQVACQGLILKGMVLFKAANLIGDIVIYCLQLALTSPPTIMEGGKIGTIAKVQMCI